MVCSQHYAEPILSKVVWTACVLITDGGVEFVSSKIGDINAGAAGSPCRSLWITNKQRFHNPARTCRTCRNQRSQRGPICLPFRKGKHAILTCSSGPRGAPAQDLTQNKDIIDLEQPVLRLFADKKQRFCGIPGRKNKNTHGDFLPLVHLIILKICNLPLRGSLSQILNCKANSLL